MTLSPTKKILKAARRIPRGRVVAYKELARVAGNPRLARLVGTLMRKNRDPRVPCHRVIRSDGRVGNYSLGGTKKKIAILRREGITIKNGRITSPVFFFRFTKKL